MTQAKSQSRRMLLKTAAVNIKKILKKDPLSLLILGLICWLVRYFWGESFPEGYGIDQQQMIFARLGPAIIDMILSLFLFFIVPLRILDSELERPNTSLFLWAERDVWPLTLESLRAMGKVILWSILFILPGLYFYLRYLFVPFIVIFNREYKEGQRDALLHSSKLTKGSVGFLMVFILGVMGTHFLASSLSELLPLDLKPASTALSILFTLLISMYSISFEFELYRSLETDDLRKDLDS